MSNGFADVTSPRAKRADQRDILSTLMEAGVLDASDLQRSDVELIAVDRRNDNTIVVIDGTPTWFAKRPKAGGPHHLVRRERELLSVLNDAGSLPVPVAVPAGDDSICITDFVDESETVGKRVQRTGRVNLEIARQIGRSLARIHRKVPVVDGQMVNGQTDAPFQPWVLNLDAPLSDVLADVSQGSLTFLRHLQTEQLAEGLGRLRRAVGPVAFTHNDVKFDNILVTIKRPHKVVLTDWETGTPGDPAWDVGSVLAEMMNIWLTSMDANESMSIDEIQSSATRPLSDILPSIRAFVDAYAKAFGSVPPEFIFRSVACCGARLVQFGYEAVQDRTSLTSHTALQMQLAVNIVSRPEDAAVRLMEIGT